MEVSFKSHYISNAGGPDQMSISCLKSSLLLTLLFSLLLTLLFQKCNAWICISNYEMT